MSTSLPIYQVDAFAGNIFGGNPAAVCPLTQWLPDELMQKLAMENNLSETAFFVPEGDGYPLRWFTPEFEIDLCGHATLASAFVIFDQLGYGKETIHFQTKSGLLQVSKAGDMLQLNFPSRVPQPATAPENLLKGLNIPPAKVFKSRDFFLVYDSEEAVRNIVPNFTFLNQLDNAVGIVVTAPGNEVDFVSRFFVPNSVIAEDPVTGSAHCNLIPYWAAVLQKNKLTAMQLSAREGELQCELNGDRVLIGGKAVLYMKGEYYI